MIPVCPLGIEPAIPGTHRSDIMGRLVHADNRLPLVGLRISAYLHGYPLGADHASEMLLGEGRSDAEGRFLIELPNTPQAGQILWRLREDPQTAVVLKIEGEQANSVYFSTPPLTLTRGTLDLDFAIDVSSFAEMEGIWAELAGRLARECIDQFNEIIRLLMIGGPSSVFGDWTVEQRHRVINALEAALLDPTGLLRAQGVLPSLAALHGSGALRAYCQRLGERAPEVRAAFLDLRATVETFDDLLSVDWIVETANFAEGDLNGPLLRARERYRAASAAVDKSMKMEGR